jgi:hypothetical protein
MFREQTKLNNSAETVADPKFLVSFKGSQSVVCKQLGLVKLKPD